MPTRTFFTSSAWRRRLFLPSVLPLACLVSMLLCSCAEGPREKPMRYTEAYRDTAPREVTVVKVWDELRQPLDAEHNGNISHFIEVDVTGGPEAGKRLTLPYDEWMVGAIPPKTGAHLVIAPADWVRRSATSKGRPFGGF